MKRIKARFTLFLILSSLFIPVLSFTPIPEVKGAELTFFEDDFESYSVGTFPSSGGWELWYNGMGNEYQVIVDSISNSPKQSLQLLGDHSRNWAAYAVRPFVTDLPTIGFNVSVKVSKIGDRNRVIAQVGFGQNLPPNRATTFAPIYFLENGTIAVSGLGAVLPYVAERWYKVTVIMDRNSETFSVWIDNVLQGQNITVRTNRGAMTAEETTWDIEGFAASQDFYSVNVFFDDVKIFSAFEANPKLELVPAKGIAATTVVGSGFAPNSKISVTWDGTPIPTVPSPLITDGYGNFTAIISVLNQTDGTYTVKAVDKTGNGATATFTVTLEAPEQTQIIVPENTSLVISVLSPENRTYSVTDVPLEYTVNRFFYWTTYSLDGQTNVTITGNTTLTGLSEGPHTIIVYIEDTPGNISSSEIVYFTVASATQGISILSPENKTYNTAYIPLTYTKNETCYYTAYSLDGQLYTDTENTTLSGLADGTHELTVYANYTDSYIGESATVWFTVDTTPPNITDVVQAPVDINGTLEDGVRVNATVTDGLSGVERVSLNYTDGNGTWVIAEMANLEGDVWNGTIPAFPHGTNVTYIIIAEDKAGNTVTTEELYGHPNQYELLPEFPLWIILPLFLVATASTIAVRKRISIPAFAKICNSIHKLLS